MKNTWAADMDVEPAEEPSQPTHSQPHAWEWTDGHVCDHRKPGRAL